MGTPNPFISDNPVTTTTTTTAPTTANIPAADAPEDDSYDDIAEEDVVVEEEEEGPSPAGAYTWIDLATPTLALGPDSLDDYPLPDNPAFANEIIDAVNSGDSGLRPRYSTAYAQYRLNSMSSAELEGLELQLILAGYMPDDTSTNFAGSRSTDLLQGFSSLIIDADYSRNKWEEHLTWAVDEMAKFNEEDKKNRREDWEKANPFITPDRQIPDYATLAQQVKSGVRGTLLRDPTASEMKLLTQYLQTEHKNAYQSNELQVAKSDWEKRARAYETEESQPGTTIDLVDPNARFGEYFEDRFAGEIEHRERVADTGALEKNLFGSLDTLSRMM